MSSVGGQPALVAFDGSPPSRAAVADAARLLRGRGALVLAAWHSLGRAAAASAVAVPATVAREAVERHDAAAESQAETLAEEGCRLAREAGLEARAVTRSADPNVPAAIRGAAEAAGASVVVLGSRGRSDLSSAVLGSTSAAVVQDCGRPVLLVRGASSPAEGDPGAGPVMFAYDGSGPARSAIERSASLLSPRPAVSLTVWESVGAAVFRHELPESMEVARDVVDELDAGTRDAAEETAREGAEVARAAGFAAEPLAQRAFEGAQRETTTAWQEVVRTAEERGAGVVVLGARGLSRVRSAVLGSVSHGVVHHCGRPVLVVPPEE